MRAAKRVDANQSAIVAALRSAGVRVYVTSHIGGGFPDLVVHRPQWGQHWRALEVKDGSKSPSRRALTPAEEQFAAYFPVTVVLDVRSALKACGIEVE